MLSAASTQASMPTKHSPHSARRVMLMHGRDTLLSRRYRNRSGAAGAYVMPYTCRWTAPVATQAAKATKPVPCVTNLLAVPLRLQFIFSLC